MTSHEIAASAADLARIEQLLADNARLVQAMDQALSIVNGWSIDTNEVGFCTLAEELRGRITEAREIRAMDHPGVGLLARLTAAEQRATEAEAIARTLQAERDQAEAKLEQVRRERDLYLVNAPVLAELEAARTAIEAARKCLAVRRENPEMHDRLAALSSAIHAYDATVKARRE